MTEATEKDWTETGAASRMAALLGFLTNPATMIATGLLAVALFATPFYLRTTEQQLFEGELLLSLCGGFSRPIEERKPARDPVPMLYR